MNFEQRLAQLLSDKSGKEEFSGVVSIKRREQLLFQEAYGFAHGSWKVKNRVDTRFRIASISKMFTAVAVLQFIEQGKLSLETNILDVLEFGKTTIPKNVTIYHLLTMTSGIADWFDETTGDWEEVWATLCREHPIYLFRTNKDYLPLFVNEAPLAEVGERYAYNGAGYILLGLAIEKLSDMSYFDYVREHIFKKANMTRSDFLALDGVDAEVAEGYIPVADFDEAIIGWKKNIYSTTPEAAADGGASSTVDDLSRFSQALRNESLLSSEMTQEILTPKVLQSPKKVREYTLKYDYGNMFVLDQNTQIVRYGHTGEEDGVSCRLYYYPKQELDVVILGNQSWCAGGLSWEIHDLIVAANR